MLSRAGVLLQRRVVLYMPWRVTTSGSCSRCDLLSGHSSALLPANQKKGSSSFLTPSHLVFPPSFSSRSFSSLSLSQSDPPSSFPSSSATSSSSSSSSSLSATPSSSSSIENNSGELDRLWIQIFDSPRSQRKLHLLTQKQQQQQRRDGGLFSVGRFCSPEDFLRVSDECVEEVQRLLSNIIERAALLTTSTSSSSSSSSSSRLPEVDLETIIEADRISEVLCNVVDVASLCVDIHSSPEFKKAALEACLRVGDVLHRLNSNTELQLAFQSLVADRIEACEEENGEIFGSWRGREIRRRLTEEEIGFSKWMMKEFRFSGVRLEKEEERTRLHQLQEKIQVLANEFRTRAARIHRDTDAPTNEEEEEGGEKRIEYQKDEQWMPLKEEWFDYLSTDLLVDFPQQFRVLSVVEGEAEDVKLLRINSITLSEVLLKSRIPELRRAVYVEGQRRGIQNLEVLEELTATRRAMTRLLGASSVADFTLATSAAIATTPTQVRDFLTSLLIHLKPLVEKEKQFLSALKLHNKDDPVLREEDLHCYMSYCVPFEEEEEEVDELKFTLGRCLNGLRVICLQLFGIQLIPVDQLRPGEVHHPSVLKFQLNEGGELIGTLYLDLHSRLSKTASWATYAVQFPIAKDRVDLSSEDRQLGVVFVSLNLEEETKEETGPVLLSVEQLRGLFHEFGHALSVLLSRTRLHSLSGMRVAADWLEVPSTLFELFVTDPKALHQVLFPPGSTLPTLSLHYSPSSSSSLPSPFFFSSSSAVEECSVEDLEKGLRRDQKFTRALRLHSVLLDYLFDLEIHSIPSSSSSLPSLNRVWSEITTRYGHFEFQRSDEEGHWPFALSDHIVSYASTYFTYQLSRVISASLWKLLFEEGGDNRITNSWREGGELLRRELFAVGGARHPSRILESILSYDKKKKKNQGEGGEGEEEKSLHPFKALLLPPTLPFDHSMLMLHRI